MKTAGLTSRLLRTVALGTILCASALPALSQETADQVIQTAQPSPDAAPATSERIVVTGTRLTTEFTSPAAVDVITVDEAVQAGVGDVAQLLRNSTVAAGSPQITAITSTAFVQSGGTGAETISLRGLGANRTLVLLDGKRAGPAGTRGEVASFDFNVLPLSAIERVEILKEGASSIYGSDAVAGVVNIITKKDDGADVDVFYSLPFDGGGDQLRVSGSWGKTIDERVRVRLTGDYFKQQELIRGDRDYLSCATPYVFNTDGSRADVIDPRTGQYTCSEDLPWGHMWIYDYTQPGAITRPWRQRPQLVQFNYENNLQNYLPGLVPGTSPGNLRFPAGWFPVGYGELSAPGAAPDPVYGPSALVSEALVNYAHPYLYLESLSPEVERITAMGSVEFDVNDAMTVYAETLLNRRMTKASGYRQFWTYQYVYDYGGGDFIGDPIAIAEGWLGDNMGLSPTAITDHSGDTISVDYMRFVGGVRGDLPFDGWSYDFSVQHSRSDGDYKAEFIWDDAITPYEFRSERCAGTLTSYRGIPCVDINWYTPAFQRGEFTPQERAFLFGTATGNTVYEQTSVEGYVSGELFELPAGPLGVVVGALYQEDSLEDVPAQVFQDNEAWGDVTAGITKGEDETKAVYAELGVPLLADLPFVQDLDLTLSGRYTDVESYGDGETYKIGLNWQISDAFRLRASNGTSFRSPALYELYLSEQQSFLGQRQIDPCISWASNLASGAISQRIADNCAADGIPGNHLGSGGSANILASGGFGRLQAETSESTSVGFVWTPSFLNLQASIDYFEIEVSDEVTQLGADQILFGCYDSTNFANEPLCNLFTRFPAGTGTEFLVDTVEDDFINIATQTNRGIDLELLYTHELPIGDLRLRGQASYTLEDEVLLLPTSPIENYRGEIGDPEWVANFDAVLDVAPFEFFWGVRYVGETSMEEEYGTGPQTYIGRDVRYVLTTGDVFYHNASVSVEPVEGLSVRLGVSNVFDEDPPSISPISDEFDYVGNAPLYSQYDFFGRTLFLNVSKTF
jgi:iron complex outermembrane recepter protein